jgi:predicted RNase H-like HicB family nuclease
MTVPEDLGLFWSEPDGATHADALKNVGPVIAAWIETARALGRETPKPKGRLPHV